MDIDKSCTSPVYYCPANDDCRVECAKESLVFYSAVRKISWSSYKCRCFTSSNMDDLIGEPNDGIKDDESIDVAGHHFYLAFRR